MRHTLFASIVRFTADPQRVRLVLLSALMLLALASLISGGVVLADGGTTGGHPLPTP